MKTIREWFEHFPQDLRDRAIKNTIEGRLEERKGNLSAAIDRAFNWTNSPEGYSFWYDVDKKAMDGDFQEVLDDTRLLLL